MSIYVKTKIITKNKKQERVLSRSSGAFLWRNFFMPRLPFLLSTTISIKKIFHTQEKKFHCLNKKKRGSRNIRRVRESEKRERERERELLSDDEVDKF